MVADIRVLLGSFERSCLNETDYPVLTKVYDERCLDKPPQVGTTWLSMVGGKLTMVVPVGGKCFGCQTEMSGKVAKYVCKNEEASLIGYEAAVFFEYKDNISCVNRTCINKTTENFNNKRTQFRIAEKEFMKFAKNAKFCDQCVKLFKSQLPPLLRLSLCPVLFRGVSSERPGVAQDSL